MHFPRQRTVTQSDKDLTKIAEDASPRRHAEISPVKVKDTDLMNTKLPPEEILCGECLCIEIGGRALPKVWFVLEGIGW